MLDDGVYSKGGTFESISTDLLLRAAEREPTAWERLMLRFRPLVKLWCRKNGLIPADASDVCQDVFGAVARGLPAFREKTNGAAFVAWLRRIATNKINDFYKRRPNPAPAAGGDENFLDILLLLDPMSLDDADFAGIDESAATLCDLPAGDSTQTDLRLDLTAIDRETRERLEAVQRVRRRIHDRVWAAYTRMICEGAPAKLVAEEFQTTRGALYVSKARINRMIRDEWKNL